MIVYEFVIIAKIGNVVKKVPPKTVNLWKSQNLAPFSMTDATS